MNSGRSTTFFTTHTASAESRIADAIFGSQLGSHSELSGLIETSCLCLTTLLATWSISHKRGGLPIWLGRLVPGGHILGGVTTFSWTGTCQYALRSFSEWLILCRVFSGTGVNTSLSLLDATMKHMDDCPIHGDTRKTRSLHQDSTSVTTRPSSGTATSPPVSLPALDRSWRSTLGFRDLSRIGKLPA